jgi:dephospho-CoA kinase
MRRVALTGGIGTGKTVVLNHLRLLGVPVIDADAVAHAVMAPGTPGAAAVRTRFGPTVMAPDGGVDRARLGALVFGDQKARRDLEAIVHPAVYQAIESWLAACAARGEPLAVAEIPLLFETGHEGDFDRVVVTACGAAEQLRRVVERGASQDDARRRIASQWSLDEKVRRADLVIRTEGTEADTRDRTEAAWRQLVAGVAPRVSGS